MSFEHLPVGEPRPEVNVLKQRIALKAAAQKGWYSDFYQAARHFCDELQTSATTLLQTRGSAHRALPFLTQSDYFHVMAGSTPNEEMRFVLTTAEQQLLTEMNKRIIAFLQQQLDQ
jgi:hypothetical protein